MRSGTDRARPDRARPDQARPGQDPEAVRLLASIPRQDPRHATLREQVVQAHLPLVRHLARRYAHLGEPMDDLMQVGTIGLIQAVDRFDPTRGTALSSYATPTILGEIRRHFRDRGWALKVPRGLQELQARVGVATDALQHELSRSPTVDEIAARLGVDAEQVIEALDARGAFATVPLEQPLADDARLAAVDTALEDVVDRESLRPLLHRLSGRDKRILVLRFFRGLSQAEIADEVGVSQMQVSRLLARILQDLRDGLGDGA